MSEYSRGGKKIVNETEIVKKQRRSEERIKIIIRTLHTYSNHGDVVGVWN